MKPLVFDNFPIFIIAWQGHDLPFKNLSNVPLFAIQLCFVAFLENFDFFTEVLSFGALRSTSNFNLCAESLASEHASPEHLIEFSASF